MRNAILGNNVKKIVPQAKSGNTSKYVLFSDLGGGGGGGNGGVLSMRMQVILDSSFARPGSAPIWGVRKGEFRDWTKLTLETYSYAFLFQKHAFFRKLRIFQ